MTDMAPLTNVPLPVKLRVEDYVMLDEAGAFETYGKTELLDGEVVYMNAQHRPHARIKSRLFRLLADALDQSGEKLEAIVEASIDIPAHNVPEPDIVITGDADGVGLVPLASVRLVIEVSDTTLQSDLERKAPIYAAHGIAEYWVVDVNDRVIHQMWNPTHDTFADRSKVAFGNRIEAMTILDLAVDTENL